MAYQTRQPIDNAFSLAMAFTNPRQALQDLARGVDIEDRNPVKTVLPLGFAGVGTGTLLAGVAILNPLTSYFGAVALVHGLGRIWERGEQARLLEEDAQTRAASRAEGTPDPVFSSRVPDTTSRGVSKPDSAP